MKTYNKSLDCLTLALAYGLKNNPVKAAKMFAQAIQMPDAKRAVATLEASNKQAFATTAAAKKVKAAEEDDIDMGDDEDLDALIGDDVDEDMAEDDVEEAAFDEDDEDDEDGEFDTEQFAKILASMKSDAAKPKAKRK